MDARPGVDRLHGGLALVAVHHLQPRPGFDVEHGAQPGVLGQPVLVVGLNPVHGAVAADEPADAPQHRVPVLEGGHLVVIIQAGLQFRQQVLIRCIRDAQHPDAVLLQRGAKPPVMRGEVRGNKNKIHG